MQRPTCVRRRHTSAQRDRILAAYRRSGLTQKKFSAQTGIGYSTLTLWLRKAATAKKSDRSTFVPVPKSKEAERLGIFGQDQFRYEAERDVYVCPQGEQLQYRHTTRDRARKKAFKIYATTACSTCPLRARCTTSRQGRRIKRWVDQGVIDRLQQRNRGQPELLKQRKALVEHPFGTIKRAMNQGYFLLKGIKKVTTETGLTVLSYNLKRVINIMGVAAMISSMETPNAWSN